MADDILPTLIERGVPDPLADLETGTHAIIDSAADITVFNAHPDAAWTLTARARWPKDNRPARHVWAALAATAESGNVVLVNLSGVDITGLPDPVQWSLLGQNSRHGSRAVTTGRGRPKVILREGVVTFTGSDRLVRIGQPFKITREVYEQLDANGFGFLSAALQTVARAIAASGPITRKALAAELYRKPTGADLNTLDMTLSRLRRHERICLERGRDGMYTIMARPPAAFDAPTGSTDDPPASDTAASGTDP